jgi:hypothetical protein
MSARAPSGYTGGDYDLSDPVNGFVDVVRRVVVRPTEFFSGVPRRGNLLAALVFALVCALISAVLGGLLRLVWRSEAIGGIRFEGEGLAFLEFLGTVLWAPIGSTIGLLIVAGIAHLLVMLFVGSGNSGFEATFKVACYAAVVNLVNWIPFIGGILALYGLYVAIVGIREMHATTMGKAALVVLLPLGVIFLLCLVVFLAVGALILSRLA